jgi:hypothetical protein
MAELVGVTSPTYRGHDLKRALLLFDRIAVPAGTPDPDDAGRPTTVDFFTDPQIEQRDAVDWLCEQGLIFNPLAQFAYPFEMPPEAIKAYNAASRIGSHFQSLQNQLVLRL